MYNDHLLYDPTHFVSSPCWSVTFSTVYYSTFSLQMVPNRATHQKFILNASPTRVCLGWRSSSSCFWYYLLKCFQCSVTINCSSTLCFFLTQLSDRLSLSLLFLIFFHHNHQFSKTSLPENQIEAGTLSKQS